MMMTKPNQSSGVLTELEAVVLPQTGANVRRIPHRLARVDGNRLDKKSFTPMNLQNPPPSFSKPGTVMESTRDGSHLANRTQKGINLDIGQDAFKLSTGMTLFESAPFEMMSPKETNKPSNREKGNQQRASTNLDMYRTDISAIQKINDYIDNQPIRTSYSSMQEIYKKQSPREESNTDELLDTNQLLNKRARKAPQYLNKVFEKIQNGKKRTKQFLSKTKPNTR